MTENKHAYLQHCLYFTTNSLSRIITRMSDNEFSALGMCTSHAFLLMLVINQPGITQKELTEYLGLAPSTVSRFIDALTHKKLLRREADGKMSLVYPTEQGATLMPQIKEAWKNLHHKYNDALGKDAAKILTAHTFEAAKKLTDTD